MAQSNVEAVVAANIKGLRQRARISQEKLAGIVGVSQSSISKIEIEQIMPSFITAMRIAKALGVRPERLLERAS